MASTSMFPGRGAISRTLSTRLAAPNDLDAFARGLIESYMPRTVADYWTYRRYMHDILCLALLEVGTYKCEEFNLSKVGLTTNDKKLNLQKPDLYTLELSSLEVGEVLLSYNVGPEKAHKMAKYDDLFALIRASTNLSINYNVLAVDLTDPEWEDSLPQLPGLHSTLLRTFISNLRYIHANSEFKSYRTSTEEFYALDKFRFELSNTTTSEMSSICESSETHQEVLDRLEMPEFSIEQQSLYVSELAKQILAGKPTRRPAPKPEPCLPQEFLAEWEEFKTRPRNTDHLPRILQLGAPAEFMEVEQSFDELVTDLKETRHHGGYLDLIKSYLAHSEPSEGHIVTLSMTDSQLLKEQMEGPGRKSALKKTGIKTERKAPKHIGVDQSHVGTLDDFIQQIEDTATEVRHKALRFPPVETTGVSLAGMTDRIIDIHNGSPMSGIAKFYQNLSQEIVINSMRRRKNRQYVLTSSRTRGVFCLIAPGAQLRTESNVEFVKVISFVRGVVNELSAPWLPVGDHWESEWLSVDTDRLKHWARAYDRTLSSSVACAERLVEAGSTLSNCCLNEVKRGNYQLLVLMYIEDKQLTSLTNQTIRYLWIKSLGDKQLQGLIRKFPTRVGSVIQSVMMQRAVAATIEVCSRPLSDFIRLGNSKRDDHTGSYDETTTGVIGKLPRLFTVGPPVPISYNLNEIYWCMMYNKDRQNPTQDALGILNKILKEEQLFERELATRKEPTDKMSYLFGNTTLEQDVHHIMASKPESHFYSRKAVITGMRLQDKHVDNMAPDHTWRTHSKINAILSKNLSEFATFKASVKTIADRVDTQDLRAAEKVGSRTKAVELIAEIVENEKLFQVFELAMTFSGDNNRLFDVTIQIFKKGQIGGIREIMILFIKARVLFNIVEEICRLLAKSDKREILTKGRDKRLMMRGDYEEVLSQFPKGSPVQMIKNSYDMTTWAQKFIPTIFTAIYRDSFREYPDIKNLATFIFLKHTNKKIEYPRKLVEAWMKHPKTEHEEPWLQAAKEKFLDNGVPYFRNNSNMCQGIPHYNSTVLALSCQSLRDELFRECLEQLGQDCRIRWKTRVGSDDKGDMIGVDMSYPEAYPQYLLFEQCAHASERLHSMELSVKSASGNVIYELNSAYMANLETLSPTIKFALAGCDMMTTSSCSSFVNESYGRIRQMRENGVSSVLCGLAHILNSDHFTTMFRTGRGMTNDVVDIFKLPEQLIPYDFGVYPFYDVDLQEIVGPEYHNYLCLTSPDCPPSVKSLLFTPLSRDDLSEAFPGDQEGLLKKDHFGIKQGLIRQLTNMRKRIGIVAADVEEFFQKNPFLIIRGPETAEETVKVIQSKLLTKGASEALRRTSPAIYLGRLSAFESAKAWRLRKPTGTMLVDLNMGVQTELEEDVPATYREFLRWGLARSESNPFPVEAMMSVIFPQRSSYEVIRQFVGQFGLRREAAKSHSQAVRSWVTNSYNYNFSNSLKTILETSFGMSQLSSKEDVEEFRKLLGFNLKSYEGFIAECTSRNVRPMDLFFYMSKIYKASKSSKVQAFANGPSTHTLHGTLISIKRFSHIPNTEMVLNLGVDPSEALKENRPDLRLEALKYFANLLLMQRQELVSGPKELSESITVGGVGLVSWCSTQVRLVKSISGFDHQTRKILVFLASQVLKPDEFKEKLLSWKTLNYSYLRRQRKVIRGNTVSWEGDLKILVNSGLNTFTLNIINGSHFISAKRIDEPDTVLSGLKDLCRLLSLDARSFFTRRRLYRGALYLTVSSKSLVSSSSSGPEENCLNLVLSDKYQYLRLCDFDSFKVRTTHDQKTGAVSVHLVEKDSFSANLCHFPGSYYPATRPSGVEIDEELWFRGIRLSKILENSDWFYNYRLVSMTDQESSGFFLNDVNFEVVLSLDTNSKSRVVDYLQVTDEANEEMFSITNQTAAPGLGTYNTVYEFEEIQESSINAMFEAAMGQIQNEGAFTFEPVTGQDWSEMVEEEEQEALENLDLSLTDEEANIKFVRSMGYVKPMRRANYQVINQLQHGYMLKDRILNMFFRNGSITAEERRSLPHYHIWLRDHSSELPDKLASDLQKMILTELQLVMGATKEELMRTLTSAPSQLGTAPRRVMNFTYGQQSDLFTQMSEQVQYTHARYEEESQASEF